MGKTRKTFNEQAKNTLRVTELGGHSIHTVTINSQKSLDLLAKAYKEVYEAAFPIKSEREPLSVWLNNLQGRNPAVDIVIVIAGDGLDTKTPTLKAISVAYYYNQQDAGLLAYNAVAPAFQGQGLGRTMVEARKNALLEVAKSKGNSLGGVFIECNDPAKVKPEDDVMDPAKRIALFEKWGARVLPIDYIQPPLETGGQKCEALKLLAYPHPETGKYPEKAGIKTFLTGIYTELAKYAGCPPEQNPDYLKTIGQIDAMKSAEPAPKQKPHQP